MQRRRQWKCPLVEIIEDRVLLTAFLVDTLVDESDGNFEPGDLSLREAIEQANANPGADMIEFSPLLSDRTIVLGGSELVISDALTITGLGADRLTIDGNNKSRIFSIGNGVTTELSDLSLTGGNGRGATSNGWGGAILSEGDLTIDGVRIHHNTVSDGIPTGAGIRQSFGALVVTNSTIDHNEITTGTGRGGGIDFGGTTFHLVNSTIANNAAGTGGGVYVVNTSDTVIRNATIAFNSSPSYGGGLASLQGVGGQITLHNSLVIGNDGKDHYDNFYGSFLNAASSFNLVGTGITGGLQNGVNGNQTGLTAAAVLESTLTNNGGPTPTLALLPGSPAIDAGDNAQALDTSNNPLTFDQRGAGFTRYLNGTVDVGAVEVQKPVTYVVDTLVDESDGDYSAGDFSLREAIALANSTEIPDRIEFAVGVTGYMQLDDYGTINIEQPVKLIGPGRDQLSIRGRFNNSASETTFEAMTLRDSRYSVFVNSGFLQLKDVLLTNNQAYSGANTIDSDGFLFLDQTDVIGNRYTYTGEPFDYGGGAIRSRGTIVVRDGIVRNNSAGNLGDASALLTSGTAWISGATFANNRSFYDPYGSTVGSIKSRGPLHVFDTDFTDFEGYGYFGNVGNYAEATFVDCRFTDLPEDLVFINYPGGSVEFIRVLFSGNKNALFNRGPAVFRDSILMNNEQGILNRTAGATSTLINTTMSGHSEFAIETYFGVGQDIIFLNSTLAENKVGIHSETQRITLYNSILVGNDTDLSLGPQNILDAQHSIIGIPDPDRSVPNAGNITGVAFNQVLFPLADNGGPTLTFAPRPGGPAVNAGSNALAVDDNGAPLVFDQRGEGFPRIFDDKVDIGAVELQDTSLPADDLIVYDQTSGRWKAGLNQGSSFSWIDGPRWNPAAGWRTWTGDVNGDGFLDGIGFSANNAIFFAINDGTGQLVSTPGGSFNSTATFQFPMIGDFDGNGTTDFLAMLSTGEWFSRRWNGTSFETGYLGKYTPTGWAEFAVGDFNGDNVDDIVGLRDSEDGQRANFIYGLSNTTPVGRRFTSQFAGNFGSSVASAGWHNLLIGEFNGDGKSDILAQTGSGQFWYAVSNGTPITMPVDLGAQRLNLSAGSNYPSATFSNPFHLGDFNGDGLDDIVTRLPNTGQFYDSHIWVGLTSFSTTAQMTSSKWTEWGKTINWGAEIVGDYNGDGLDDLAGLDVGRQLTFVSLSNGTALGPTLGFGPITGANSILDPDAADSGLLG